MPSCLGMRVKAKLFVQKNHLDPEVAGGAKYGPAPMKVRDGKARLCLLVEARLRLRRMNILPLSDIVCDSSTRQAAWRIIPRSEWSW